jgi:hypothetical protein
MPLIPNFSNNVKQIAFVGGLDPLRSHGVPLLSKMIILDLTSQGHIAIIDNFKRGWSVSPHQTVLFTKLIIEGKKRSMSKHYLFRYSVTIVTDDLALVGCLRGLSQHCQETINPRIPWGGTKKEDWLRAGHKVTFHFSNPNYRSNFLGEVERLLPRNLWRVAFQSDNDPATPQTS